VLDGVFTTQVIGGGATKYAISPFTTEETRLFNPNNTATDLKLIWAPYSNGNPLYRGGYPLLKSGENIR
jgi:hypothetical protein